MPKESVLSQEEKDSIEIEKLIFHIIFQNNFRPKFLDEVILNDDQRKFFKARLIDASSGTQYIFIDKETSPLYENCKLIAEDSDLNFLQSSKVITNLFKVHHNKTTSDGVFITALVRIKNGRNLVFLIKLDNKKVYEYKISGNRALLEEIKNTFVEDKKALQKIALVDVSNYYKWDILAYDRTAPSGITNYFRGFLSAVERETPEVLTKNAIKLVRHWALNIKLELDPTQEVSSYKTRAFDYLKNNNTFDCDNFIETVIFDEDIERKTKLKQTLKVYLEENGLYGQNFSPHQKSLDRSIRKNIRKTAEGLTLEWEGDPQNANIQIPTERNSNDGLYHIKIKTREITVIS